MTPRRGPRRRRVVFCVQNLPVPHDPRVWREARDLAAAGYEVTVVCPDRPDLGRREVREGVEIMRYPAAPTWRGLPGQIAETLIALLWTAILVFRMRVQGPIAALHAANPPDTFFLIGLALRPFGCRFVFDQHDPVPELLRAKGGHRPIQGAAARWMEWASYRTAALVITPNGSCRRLALARSGKPESDVIEIRNGPDAVSPVELAKATVPAIVAFAGTINSHRGLQVLMHAAADILARRPGSIRLEIMGDGDALGDMRRLAQRLNIDGSVEWPGWLEPEELRERLGRAAVAVAPDEDTEFMRIATSTKVTDYLSLGLPAVVTDLPENRVTGGDAVVYFRPGDAADLSRCIEELIDDPNRRAAYAARAPEQARKLLWVHSGGRLVEAYGALIGQPAALRPPAA